MESPIAKGYKNALEWRTRVDGKRYRLSKHCLRMRSKAYLCVLVVCPPRIKLQIEPDHHVPCTRREHDGDQGANNATQKAGRSIGPEAKEHLLPKSPTIWEI